MGLAPLAPLHLLRIPPEKRRRKTRRRMKVRWRLVLEEEEEGEEPVTERRNEREDDVGRHGGGRAQLSHHLLPIPALFPDPYPSLARGTAAVYFDGGSVEPGGGDDDGERKKRRMMTRSGKSGAEGPGHGRRMKIQSGWDLGVGERVGGVVHLHGSSAQTDNPALDMPQRECPSMPGC